LKNILKVYKSKEFRNLIVSALTNVATCNWVLYEADTLKSSSTLNYYNQRGGVYTQIRKWLRQN